MRRIIYNPRADKAREVIKFAQSQVNAHGVCDGIVRVIPADEKYAPICCMCTEKHKIAKPQARGKELDANDEDILSNKVGSYVAVYKIAMPENMAGMSEKQQKMMRGLDGLYYVFRYNDETDYIGEYIYTADGHCLAKVGDITMMGEKSFKKQANDLYYEDKLADELVKLSNCRRRVNGSVELDGTMLEKFYEDIVKATAKSTVEETKVLKLDNNAYCDGQAVECLPVSLFWAYPEIGSGVSHIVKNIYTMQLRELQKSNLEGIDNLMKRAQATVDFLREAIAEKRELAGRFEYNVYCNPADYFTDGFFSIDEIGKGSNGTQNNADGGITPTGN